MSLLTQFYPSSTGGEGSGYTGLVNSVYSSTLVQDVLSCAYNGVTGWYYLLVQYVNTETQESDVRVGRTPVAVTLVSRDGESWSMSSSFPYLGNSASWVIGQQAMVAPPAGSSDAVTLTSWSDSSSGSSTDRNIGYSESPTQPVSFSQSSLGTATGTSYLSTFYDRTDGTYVALTKANPPARALSNDGVTWSSSMSTIPLPGSPAGCSFAYRYYTDIYAYQGTNLLRSTNAGSSWSTVTTSLPTNLGAIVAGGEGNGVMTSTGGYYSTDHGLTWTAWNPGPDNITTVGGMVYNEKADVFVGKSTTLKTVVVSTDGTGSQWRIAAPGNTELQAQMYSSTNWVTAPGMDIYMVPPALGSLRGAGIPSTNQRFICKVDASSL